MTLTNIIFAILSGVLPSLLWLWFWLKEDNLHPEPRSLIVGSFLAGAVGVIVVLPLQMITSGLTDDQSTRYAMWAIIEEIVKFAGAYFIALKSHDMDEPVDAMIYLITVALGFAAVENTLFIMGPLSDGDLARTIVTGNMRFIGATLVHVVSSALVGFSIGLAMYRARSSRFLFLLLGLISACVLHTAFNLSIINATAIDTLKTFGWVWAGVVVIIVLFEEVKGVRPRAVPERMFDEKLFSEKNR